MGIFFGVMGVFFGPLGKKNGVMALFFGPLGKTCLESWFPDFQTPLPKKLSDPNLTPLPTHPGIKYVARVLAAISPCRTAYANFRPIAKD